MILDRTVIFVLVQVTDLLAYIIKHFTTSESFEIPISVCASKGNCIKNELGILYLIKDFFQADESDFPILLWRVMIVFTE